MIENKIVNLDDRQHALRKIGMYLGSNTVEGHEQFVLGKYGKYDFSTALIKIVEETFQNSIDEAIRTNYQYGNKINIIMTDTEFSVEDNGRGLPQNIVINQDGSEVPGAVSAWTNLKSGGNFADDANRKTIGTNGMGVSLANIFSLKFLGITCNGENEIAVLCENNLETIDWSQKKKTYKGTKVTISPDFQRLGSDKFNQIDFDVIRSQIETLAVIYPDIQFKFNGSRVHGNFKKYVQLYDEHAVISETDKVQLALCKSDDGFKHLSYANGIHTKVGGSHVDYVMDSLSDELIPMIKRKFKIDVNKARIKECITLLLFVKDLSNMRFDSQTKERLTSPMGEIKSHIDIDIKKLSVAFMKNEALLMPIIESVLARKLAAEKAAETKANKAASKAKVAKHIKANKYGDDTLETTLFLTEGDSAIGYLISTRDRDLHGGFPLRGKFMNTWKMPPAEILKNAEAFDICAITGLQFGERAINPLPDGEWFTLETGEIVNINDEVQIDGIWTPVKSFL